jgi:hypothetical protein
MAEVVLDVLVDAPAQAVWDLLFDWPRQGEWMLGTRVRVIEGDGASVGSRVEAWTGAGRLGFLDVFDVTRWEPPRRCDVVHVGRVVRGTGTFEVLTLPGGRSRFVWAEDLDLPLGAVGRLGWPIVRPAFLAGVRRSLHTLAALVESERR